MKITKEQYDALPDFMKATFKADGDGYTNGEVSADEVETITAGLKANNQALLDEKRTETEKRTAAEKAAKEAADKAARDAGNIEAVDKSWQEKFAEYDANTKGKLESYHTQISKLTVGNAATQLAAKLFGKNAGIMQRHVAERMTLEETDGGEFKVRILKDGKPSALTTDDLEKEFRANADFASVLAGSAAGGTPKPGAGKLADDGKPAISMTHSFGMDSLTAQAAKIIADMPDDE